MTDVARPPLPPFDADSAAQKARLAEDAWNSRDPQRVSLAYTSDSNRIAVRFASEWHDDSGQWFRSHGNENWEFSGLGLMQRRVASINDVPIRAEQRLFLWPAGRRPDDHPGLTQLGL